MFVRLFDERRDTCWNDGWHRFVWVGKRAKVCILCERQIFQGDDGLFYTSFSYPDTICTVEVRFS